MTSKEVISEKERLNNGTMTEMSKPDEYDDDVDEMTVVMKSCFREILRFKILSVGQVKAGTTM